MVAAALAWAVLFRGPFLHFAAIDGDESLFLLIGKGWMGGQAPYTAIWDLKPPGLYLIYGLVWRLFGDDLAGPKIASLTCVVLTSLALYAFAARHLRSRRTGWVALALYAPSTLAASGLASKPDLIMLPFIAWGPVAALGSVRAQSRRGQALAALAAGLLLGCAGMVKQTAAFEAAAFFVLLALADRGPGRRGAAFVLGCAVAPALFAAWFAHIGLFAPLIHDVVLSAFRRAGGDGVSPLWGALRFAVMLGSIAPLALGAALLWLERRSLPGGEVRQAVGVVAGWTLASTLGALAMRAFYPAYLQPLLPPLCLLTATFLTLTPWPRLSGRPRIAAAAALALVAIAVPVVQLLGSSEGRLVRTRLPEQVGAYLRGVLHPGERIYVVDYEPAVYLLSGAAPPTRFVLPMHLVCSFPAAQVSPQAEIARIMDGDPRCLVLAASRRRMGCERPEISSLPERLGRGRYTITRRFSDGGEAVDVLCRPAAPDRTQRQP